MWFGDRSWSSPDRGALFESSDFVCLADRRRRWMLARSALRSTNTVFSSGDSMMASEPPYPSDGGVHQFLCRGGFFWKK
jgi:hypothetical protein